MNMFNHGNTVTFPEGPHIDANTLKLIGVEEDAIRVRLFPFSLTNSAKEWFECMPLEKVSTWKDIVAAFLDKYYPPGITLKLKSEIFQFIQGHDEPLYEAFARFKAPLPKCPNHGFTMDHQVGILYNGFNQKIYAMLDSGANGGFLRKSGEDAMAVIEEFATNGRGWSKERHNMKRIVAIEEAEESSFAKELAQLRVRVDQMDTSRKEDPIPPTSIIAVSKPETHAPVVEEINYMQGGGSNRNYNNNYRPNQGGGFSVGKGGVVETTKKEEKYDQGITRILEVIAQDRQVNDTKIRVVKARINNLEQGMNTISTAIANINTQMEQIQKKLDEDRAKAAVGVDDINKKWGAKQKSGDCPVDGGPLLPPQRAAAEAPNGGCPAVGGPPHTPRRAATETAEPPTQQGLVRHNGIEIPKYAKLLREAVMMKKKPTKADLKLPHHCSEIIQKERAVKQRDPGQFIIRCRIGEGKVDMALCDLGSSINLMPLKYYEKLNIGPLKTSEVTLRYLRKARSATMTLSHFSKLMIWARTWEYESLEDLMSGLLERSRRRAEEMSGSFDTSMETWEKWEKKHDMILELSSNMLEKLVNSFKPSLSLILIPCIADETNFDEDPQLSHARGESRSKAKKSKLRNHLRYNLCGFNLMYPLSNSVFAQSSAATLDKLRRAWVRYKVPC
ncbi:uncharacterized protein LOC125220284 [Salvia hispanica]|uniref:uncharacterized protein LOC125220284 n=1 Tax=Salvia hispanica TaxID=49212 RepID=UPI002009181C|nr:uncharacterized protein LOC125220284 [Salvia hispanica]